MLVPLSWLAEYVDIDLPVRQLADRLTASGSSVERIYEVGTGMDDLIVAEVLEVKPHPNADRLRLATVSTGQEYLQIVCGAPNLAVGQRIVFAPVGSTVPVNMHDESRQPFVLTSATIRGVESQGMICSAAELGLGNDHEGILVLPEDAKVGESAARALGYPQVVLDIEVTTNRPDELSMIGIAREVSALIKQPVKVPAMPQMELEEQQAKRPVIEDPACYRLVTQQMEVTVGPSPWWLQQRLALCGMRPINNVVDITNYIMLEYGQPMHAYDTAQLQGQTLYARLARQDERITTLDGIERTLRPPMLVIADEIKPVGIAGVMGGLTSKTSESTKLITLEAAAFDPVSVRKTANTIALRSEASRRFERGVDPEMTDVALSRAVQLLVEFAHGVPLSLPQDAYPTRLSPKAVSLSHSKLSQYMGKDFPLDEAENILQVLGFEQITSSGAEAHTDTVKADTLTVAVPSWRRRDIEGQEDLIEEVIRMAGYDSVPVLLPLGRIPNRPINAHYKAKHGIKTLLSQAGFIETLTISLTHPDGQSQPGVAVANPLSAEWTHMRQQLLPGLLQTAKRNSRLMEHLQLFELSDVYIPTNEGLPDQLSHLAVLMTDSTSVDLTIMKLKGLLSAVMDNLGIDPTSISYLPSDGLALLDPRGGAQIHIHHKSVGWIGQPSPLVLASYDLPSSTVVAELDMSGYLHRPSARQFKAIPKYPSVEEDLSLLMDEEREVGFVVGQIYSAANGLVGQVKVTDIYRHSSLGKQKKSPLLHITYRAADHTLSADEVAQARQRIVDRLQQEGIDVRE